MKENITAIKKQKRELDKKREVFRDVVDCTGVGRGLADVVVEHGAVGKAGAQEVLMQEPLRVVVGEF